MASVGRNWRIAPILLISKCAVWQILSTCYFMVSPLSNVTPRLQAEQEKGISLWPIPRTSGRSEDLGQRAELQSCLRSVGASCGWFASLHRSQFCMLQKRESVLERGAELYNSVSSTNMWCRTEWHSMITIEAVCTVWRGSGRALSPEEHRTTKRTAPIHDPQQKQSASSHSDMTEKKQRHSVFLYSSKVNVDQPGTT